MFQSLEETSHISNGVLLITAAPIISSMYTTYANGRSLSSWCRPTFRWKHCAAFFNPYGMRIETQSSDDWCIFLGSLIYTQVDLAEHRELFIEGSQCGKWKSPQTRHEPSDFLTACIGEVQFDAHKCIMLSSSP